MDTRNAIKNKSQWDLKFFHNQSEFSNIIVKWYFSNFRKEKHKDSKQYYEMDKKKKKTDYRSSQI